MASSSPASVREATLPPTGAALDAAEALLARAGERVRTLAAPGGRLDAERHAREGAKLEFGDTWAKLQPSGDVAELGYAGFDPQGSIFRFLGYVTQRKVVSFWLVTESRDSEASGKIFDEAFRGLKFYVP